MRGQVKVYQKKIIARRRRRITLITLYSVLVIGLIVCGLSFLSRADALTIDTVEVIGTSRLATSTVRDTALGSLVGNYGYLFSKQNTLIYPHTEVREALSRIPLVEKVEVSRRGLKALYVSITEREEVARFCSDEPSRCFSLDEDGRIFAEVSGTSTGAMPDELVYRAGVEGDPIGADITQINTFKNVQFFVGELKRLSLDPREITLGENGYMTITLGLGGRLFMNATDDLSQMLSNISSVLDDTKVVQDLPSFLANLDYMKLDGGNKIVYKLK